MTITDFLLARIAEDEAAARGCLEYGEGRWRWIDPLGKVKQALVDERDVTVLPSAWGDVYPSVSVADHIARHDPARTLRECEAKRRIVERHEIIEYRSLEWYSLTDMKIGEYIEREETLRILASVYSDHPDYSDEWAL